MLIDDVQITVKAGKGGDGAMAFNKIKMALGPTGASGGKGGDVYLEGVSNLSALTQFRYKKVLTAENGMNGKTQFNDGHNGDDLVLKIPIGTVVHNLTTNQELEVITIGQKLLIAKGGIGGKGNFKFRSSTNTSPTQFENGLSGEEYELRLELKLIADVGFIGLPNVGKSSLLNELTNAKSKIANYPFTTLDPNLGTYYELILADIPGLIEGASIGKGLGIKFLRHVERTKTLFHFISAESLDPAKDYQIIKNELAAYNKELLEKPEYIFLSKADLFDKKEITKKLGQLKKIGKKAIPISVIDDESIKLIEKILRDIIKQKY
ncbi:MAG: GTPase ObgE [Parcubacteria group bacterium CG10_big_fil_rev_8_21_14_0_10_35_15]|nr:MAG: GTPase ObgE [Parcubacteria group bacterium CG10_big_fil_rev_8_21_14_0_10_35_15]